MYDDAEGWISYREANARYYAADIGKEGFGRTRDKAPQVREYVDQALAALPRARPLVVFTDAACKGIWAGLNHAVLGCGSLPGWGSNHPDLAVVLCVSGENVPRPTHLASFVSSDRGCSPVLTAVGGWTGDFCS
jgi:RNase H domain-containing protein